MASPHRIVTNAEGYEVADANLLNLCKIGLKAEVRQARLLVRLDVSSFDAREVDLTISRHLPQSSRSADARDYFSTCRVTLSRCRWHKGTREGTKPSDHGSSVRGGAGPLRRERMSRIVSGKGLTMCF